MFLSMMETTKNSRQFIHFSLPNQFKSEQSNKLYFGHKTQFRIFYSNKEKV